jgi:hypothetical protein
MQAAMQGAGSAIARSSGVRDALRRPKRNDGSEAADDVDGAIVDQTTSSRRTRAVARRREESVGQGAVDAWRLAQLVRPLLCAAMVVAGSSTAQADAASPSLRERMGFSGRVSRVVTEEEREGVARRIRAVDLFREEGSPEERTAFAYDFQEGTLRTRTVTFFDETGKVLSAETTDSEDELVSQVIFRYGDGGRLIERVTYGRHGALAQRVTYERTDAGDVAEQLTYDAQGSISARQVFEYDSDRNVVREETYRGANLDRVIVMTYDADGTPRTRDTYRADGDLLRSRHYSDGGLFYDETTFDDAGDVHRRSRATLDERGNFREMIEYGVDGEVNERSTFTYDERHLLVEETLETVIMNSPSTVVTRYEYEFDEHGNWTRRLKIEEQSGLIETSTVLETLYRTIDYHSDR